MPHLGGMHPDAPARLSGTHECCPSKELLAHMPLLRCGSSSPLTWEGSIQMRVPASPAAVTSSSTFSYGCTATAAPARCSATSDVT